MRDQRLGIRLSASFWLTCTIVFLTLVYTILHVVFAHAMPGMHVAIARPPTIPAGAGDALQRLDGWRDGYWHGHVIGLVSPSSATGMLIQIFVFTAAAMALLVLRGGDLTAQLCLIALALSGVAGGGPLFGVETALPFGLWRVLTVFTWMSGPAAFPIIALAIVYFPSASPLIRRYPWLHAVPFVAAAPMLALSASTSLYLVGVDGFRSAAMWDARHPAAYFGSFALALAINVAAVVEGVYRYRFNHAANERRRIRMAVYTAVPGVFAYAIKDGTPIVAGLMGWPAPTFPWPITVLLQATVLLPAFGLTYAVGVARVLGPAFVLRRGLQYALARRTLTIVAILPPIAFALSLVAHQDETIAQLAHSDGAYYLMLAAVTAAAFRYRGRARQWLDQRFFREEYDARKILVSLAGRVRFETDPADLASLVTRQIDEALHPEIVAMLASGVLDGQLSAISAGSEDPAYERHRALEPLPLDGGVASLLRWSPEPLEVFLDDPRSPARRLPQAEIEWLETHAIALMVPVLGKDGALVAALVLGAKRSEEAYTAEDRELLASIAVQVGLGLDVARLRLQSDDSALAASTVKIEQLPPMMERPRCGRIEDAGATTCPADATALKAGPIPRVLDGKYRVDQLLGRGGMGAVYRARDMRLDRLVAIKVVRPELLNDSDARRRFRREAQIVAKLQHPAIVAIHDFGTLPAGGAYLVMELVRGEDLRRVLHREGRLEAGRAVRILSTVCGAIDVAHREGVLHRDLKPENILLPGADGEAKVLDFGVAKLVADPDDPPLDRDEGTLTLDGTIVGTPAYMAPEQLRAEVPGPRTDVFALGVIAYEMLTGELPFGRGALADVVLAQARGVRRLTMIDPRIAPALDRAVMRALQLSPEARPTSAQEFAVVLLQSTGAAV